MSVQRTLFSRIRNLRNEILQQDLKSDPAHDGEVLCFILD